MHRLVARVEALERRQPGSNRRPVLLVSPSDDAQAKLAEWQSRHGPCDSEPLFVHLVGVKPSRA